MVEPLQATFNRAEPPSSNTGRCKLWPMMSQPKHIAQRTNCCHDKVMASALIHIAIELPSHNLFCLVFATNLYAIRSAVLLASTRSWPPCLLVLLGLQAFSCFRSYVLHYWRYKDDIFMICRTRSYTSLFVNSLRCKVKPTYRIVAEGDSLKTSRRKTE